MQFFNLKSFTQYFVSLLLVISMAPSVLLAQAWTKSKGEGFYKLDYSSIQASDLFDSKGNIVPFNRTISNGTASFYGEYGISNKVTAIAYIPFFVANKLGARTTPTASPSSANSGFGDADLGLRIALPVKAFAVSANILLGLPTGISKQANDLVTGDGEFNQMLKIAMGTGKKKWWTQGALGFNNRNKGYSDEFRYDFEFGYKFLNDRLLAIFKINGVESLNNGTVAPTKTGLYSNNVVYLGVGPEFLYYLNSKKTVGLSARLGLAPRAFNNLAAPSFSVGFFAQL